MEKDFYYGEFWYFYTGKYHKPCQIPIEIQQLLRTVRPYMTDHKAWMKRLEAMKIEDILEPDKIVPVKSIVIHTGINNINSE